MPYDATNIFVALAARIILLLPAKELLS